MIKVLEELKIPYMITGAVASILYGEPRLTDDIDVVIALKRTDVPLLRKSFPEGEFYVPPDEEIFEEMDRKVLNVSGNVIDRNYIERWSKELDIDDIWEMILQKVKEL